MSYCLYVYIDLTFLLVLFFCKNLFTCFGFQIMYIRLAGHYILFFFLLLLTDVGGGVEIVQHFGAALPLSKNKAGQCFFTLIFTPPTLWRL